MEEQYTSKIDTKANSTALALKYKEEGEPHSTMGSGFSHFPGIHFPSHRTTIISQVPTKCCKDESISQLQSQLPSDFVSFHDQHVLPIGP